MRISLSDVVDLDYEKVAKELANYIHNVVVSSSARGVVVGVSGGVDSATTLALAVKALGASRVHALVMPDSRTTPRQDVEDAIKLVEQYGVSHDVIEIDRIVDAFMAAPWKGDEKSIGNIRARVRMTLLYYYANAHGYLVLGTGDRSEFLIGYFTKYGDGAADVYPISVLYKTQVRRLAKYLGVPDHIAYKPSSPRLWPGHMAEKELGLTYEQIDLALFALFDLGLKVDEASRATGLDTSILQRVLEMHEKTRHKRTCFSAPSLDIVRAHWKGFARVREEM